MKRKLLVSLEVEVSELPAEERQAAAKMAECAVGDLPGLADVSADELARLIAYCLPVYGRQFFDGSMTYARFTKGTVKSAAYGRVSKRRA